MTNQISFRGKNVKLAIMIAAVSSFIIMIHITTLQPAVAQASPPAQRIIDIVHSNCEQLTTSIGFEGVLPAECVALKYESPNLVVLDAKMFLVDTTDTSRSVENDLIWQAVEAFIALQGYSVDSIVLSSAQRNEPNPDEFIVVMSK